MSNCCPDASPEPGSAGRQRKPAPIVSVVGKTNNGKTTLLERLIPELKRRGYTVAAIKHDAHEFEIDHEGKDTYRLAQAGADAVIISSPARLAAIARVPREQSLDDIAGWLVTPVDIILTEGYKRQNKPKIEVTRTGELLCGMDDRLMAVVNNIAPGPAGMASGPAGTDQPRVNLPAGGESIPCFMMDEISRLADFIVATFIQGKNT